jgi:hypothetical protein
VIASAPLPPLVSVRCTVQLQEADEEEDDEEGETVGSASGFHDSAASRRGSGGKADETSGSDEPDRSTGWWGRGRSSGDKLSLDAAVPPNRHVGVLQCSVKLPAHTLLARRRHSSRGEGAARGGDDRHADSGRRSEAMMQMQQGLSMAGGSVEAEAALAGFDRLLTAAHGVVAAAHAAYDAAAR